MGSLSSLFTFGSSSTSNTELPNIFPLSISQHKFIETDIVNIYSKILTDVMERTHGLSEDQQNLLWDNCVVSDSPDGLITMLAKAMSEKKELFLVYDAALKVITHADETQKEVIREDYQRQGMSNAGIYISFRNYIRSDMVRIFSALEYCTIDALNKDINLSKAIQIKLNDLRGSTALMDKEIVKAQAKLIADSLAKGRDILLDVKDMIETSNPDLTPIKESINFLNQKRSFYLGMPEAYVSGIQTGGMGSSGEGDTKAVERGLKNYYFSIIKPVMKSLFGIETKYKSQDFRMISQGLQALQTFGLVDDELMSQKDKKWIIDQLFDFDSEGE